MMNQNNTQAQELTTAITSLTVAVNELIALAKEEETEATTTTATTTTDAEATTAETTTTTTAPIIVIDDDDNVIATTTGDLPCPPEATEFTGSMIEQDMDPMPSAKTAEAAEDVAQKITDETAAEANAEKMLDDIIADISALYNISSYALSNEGKNIESDRSPYAPKENKMGVIGDYQVFIAKEVIKDCDHVTGSFRLIIKDKTIVTPIMELELRLIDGHYKVFSSENTHRMEKMKEDHDLMRFLEITEEVSALIMSRYLAD